MAGFAVDECWQLTKDHIHMQASEHLAFDLGASSGRAVLGRFDGSRMEMQEVHRWVTPNEVEGERLYWDLDAVWGSMQEGLAIALKEAPDLCSLSVDSWGVDYVPLGSTMQTLRRAHVYRDPRSTSGEALAWQRVAREDLYSMTGVAAHPINTLFQVLADEQMTPEVYAATCCRLLIADYMHWRFCDRFVAEMSLASTTQLLSANSRSWSVEAMKALQIDPVTWPRVVPSGTVLGPVRDIPNVAVIAGCSHDTACAVAAIPADERSSWAFLSSGTWSLLGVEIPAPICTPAAMESGFTNEVGYGGTIRLLKNLTGLWVLQECERVWREAGMNFDYTELLDEASRAVPPVYTIDFNDPKFSAPGNMPKRIADWCRERGMSVPSERGDIVRLILESLAEVYRTTLESLSTLLGRRFECLHVVGGGSRNRLLNQWTADRCGVPVIAGPSEATALGNLLIQAGAMNRLPADSSVREVSATSVQTETFQPNQSGGP